MILSLEQFLDEVITTDKGSFCLAYRPANTSEWINEWFDWPNSKDDIITRVQELREGNNVYFSPHLFTDKVKSRTNVLASRTISADLDEAKLDDIPLQPTIVVETSPDRHQAYWVFDSDIDVNALEVLSRKLTYSIPNADHSGWQLGHMVRLPTSQNYKYFDGVKSIEVINYTGKIYTFQEIELLPDHSEKGAELDLQWINSDIPVPDKKPLELLESVRQKIAPKVYNNYSVEQKDRSAALWALECAAFRAGLTREQVFGLAYHSANNKFATLKYHGNRELAKDVLRAERFVSTKVVDMRSAITVMRKMKGFRPERNQQLFSVVKDLLNKEGEFFHADDETLWYIRRDSGRPIDLSRRSNYLNSLLDLEFGLNASESEQGYVVDSLMAYARNMEVNASMACMSTYDTKQNRLLFHGGRKDVYQVTTKDIIKTTNGSFGTLFAWSMVNEPCALNFNPLPEPWWQIIFGLEPYNVTSMPEDLFLALTRVWLIFLLMRDAVSNRPILAFLGQPGAGKSSIFRRLYVLLYGKKRSIDAVSEPDDFDQAVSSDPFICLDNVYTWERWLPDRLALSLSTSDRQKRELWTNKDTVIQKRQAMLGINAHNPKFGREDVADRMLVCTFDRLPFWKAETPMLERINELRDKLWGAIMLDMQAALRQVEPAYEDIPQFRVEDFGRLGYRIAQGLGIGEAFKKAIATIRTRQKNFTLEEDNFLVSSIGNMVARLNGNSDWMTANKLFGELQNSSGDSKAFQHQYGNAQRLSKKLNSMQDSLKEVFDIDKKLDAGRGIHVWKITKKD